MKRDEVIATLRAHEPELRAAGVVRLSLFGSAARDEARADSDIDLLAAFDDRPLSLLDVKYALLIMSEAAVKLGDTTSPASGCCSNAICRR
jgi:predicted nucleotidyltransferase